MRKKTTNYLKHVDMNSTIEIQKELDTLLNQLIEQEKITANHIRISGHATDTDKKTAACIRYSCLALIEKAYSEGLRDRRITAVTPESQLYL